MDYSNQYLSHYGAKGMKWGVRRYQNPDGTLTKAGKEKYGSSYDKDIASFKPYAKTGISTKSGKQVLTPKDVQESIKAIEKVKNDHIARLEAKGVRKAAKNKPPATLKAAPNVSKQTKKAISDYNKMSDKEFQNQYSVKKSRYAKRVEKYVDPYMNAPLAKIGKIIQAEAARNGERWMKNK